MASPGDQSIVIVGSKNFLLSQKIVRLATESGLRGIGTNSLDRIVRELKQPGRCAVLDMGWEAIQSASEVRTLVNIGAICGNKVVCICPNKDEDLKKIARQGRPTEIFLRYDLELSFKQFLEGL